MAFLSSPEDKDIPPPSRDLLEKANLPPHQEWMKHAFPEQPLDQRPVKPEPPIPRPAPKPSYFSSLFSQFDISKWIVRPRSYYPDFDKTPHSNREPKKWEDLSEEKESIKKLFASASFRNSPLGHGIGGVMAGTALGFIGSMLQNAVQTHNHGWKGVFTRTGGTIWGFALAGGVYGFIDAYGQKVRKKDDAMGKFTAGCAAGFMVSMQARSLPLAIGSCVFLGTPVAILQAQGGSLRGDGQFEYASSAGQKALRYSTMFRPPPMTSEERIQMEKALGRSADETQQKEKVMTPALKKIIEDKAAR